MKKKILVSLLALFFASSGLAGSISVNPSYMHLGTLQPGQTETVTLYINSRGYSQSFSVRPEYSDPLTSSVFNGLGPVRPDAYSQEDIKSWVRFPEGSYRITPSSSRRVTVNGETVMADGTVKMTIVVPSDAEPGYHAGSIKLNPSLSNSKQGFGTSVRVQTFSQFSFKVSGNANRNLGVTDVQVIRTGEESAKLRTYVKNYGSVTTRVRGGTLKILTMNGQRLTKVDATGKLIPPGQTKVVKSFWEGNLEGGRYQVSGSLNYVTGKATLSETFNLPDRIQVRDANDSNNQTGGGSQTSEKEPLPLWLVVLALVILGVLMYSFEIDPVWILAIVGFLGIAAFILMSSISNIYLAGLLISAVLLTYYGLM
ncbi:MAG: hypothetical protein ABEK16_02900 [Candidatus Nanohalobium sp.]